MSILSREMIEKYAEKRGLDVSDTDFGRSNADGIRLALEAWCRGEGTLDARLTDSPETRDLFAPVRNAYFTALGQPEPEYSNVSFHDPDVIVETVDGESPKSESQEGALS